MTPDVSVADRRKSRHPFCDELRRFRNATGMSLERLEEKTDGKWKAVVIGSYERGDRHPTMDRLDKYLGVYGKRLAIVDVTDPADPDAAADVQASEAIRALKLLIARAEAAQGPGDDEAVADEADEQVAA